VNKQNRLDWGQLASLKLRARTIADGILIGAHRSTRRGAGVEFGGHRNYSPGDDLRFLDRRVLMRHGRLTVRVFETETERLLALVVDASRSMAYRSNLADETKLSFATLLAAALSRVALNDGDRVSLDWFGGEHCRPVAATGGSFAFDQLVEMMEQVDATHAAPLTPVDFEHLTDRLDRRTGRGAIIVLFSDLLDLSEQSAASFARLASRRRVPVVVRVLDPMEKQFAFSGSVRLRASETGRVVETDAEQVREQYLAVLEDRKISWSRPLISAGGQLVDCTTADDPVRVLREVLLCAGGRIS